MAAQVRGFRDGPIGAAKEQRLKLERRNGSQSLCSSSSELQDSSAASSPSSTSTLSLASSTLATVYHPKPSRASSRRRLSSSGSTNYQPSSCGPSDADHSQIASSSSSQARKSLQLKQQQQPLTWRRSSTQLGSNRLSGIVARSSRGSLSSGSSNSCSSSSTSTSNESSRRSSSKSEAPPITASRLQTSANKTPAGQGRSSIDRQVPSLAATRHLQLHYGSLSSLANLSQQQQQRRRTLLQSDQSSSAAETSRRPPFDRHHYGPTSALIGQIDVRGQKSLCAHQKSVAQQQQQQQQRSRQLQKPQVRQARSCSVVRQPPASSSSSSLASSAPIAAVAGVASNRAQPPASSATTNSRLRQAALYARRHSRITPATTTSSSQTNKTNPPSAGSRCPLIANSSSLARRGISAAKQSTSFGTNYHAAHASPRVSSLVGPIGKLHSPQEVVSDKSPPSFGLLGQSQRRISSSSFSLASSGSSLLSRQHQHQLRLETAKRVKAANDSRAARELKALESGRKIAAINTKSSWRSNLLHQQIPSKMTTALASIRYTCQQPQQHPAAAAAAAKKSDQRSDGCSADSCCSSTSGDASDCANDENVQPPVATAHLLARANINNNVDEPAASIGLEKSPIGPHQQQVGEKFIGTGLGSANNNNNTNSAKETTADSSNLLAAAQTSTIPTLAVEAVLTTATAATDRPFDVLAIGGDSCCQPLATGEGGGILVPLDFSHNIVHNNIINNNNINKNSHPQQQQALIEENITKRPLSDIELDCDPGQKLDIETEMTNVKIKIQRKLSIAPDVTIKTEPICLYYDLEARPFARGKFAQVKRCISKTSKQCFAAKCIKKRRRLVDIRHEIILEIEALKLSHYTEHIVKLYEVFETPTEMVLVLEMANGGELQRVIDNEEAIDEKLVKRWLRQILEGLVQLHDNDIAHLDIKPQNLLLTEPFPEGDVKLCDFGISRRITKDCEIREICGTPDYVAPEILRYDPISLATDMWSLGVLTYVLLTGYSPFGSENRQQTFCNITQATLDFPSEIFYKISEDAVDFIQKLIVREPTERLTSQQARNHPWLCQ